MTSVMNSNSRLIGVILVLSAALLWGISGTVAQYLFHEHAFTAEWLVVIRLIIAGVLLLLIPMSKGDKKVWSIWKNSKGSIVFFGIVGMLGVQYTYFAAIEASNAATATLLQYLAPVLIVLFVAFKLKSLPARQQMWAIALALLGTFLLVTHGNFQQLSISGSAFFWGITSAFALAFYTLYPIKLLNQYGSAIVVGWGMVVGGVGMSFVHPPWKVEGEMTTASIVALGFVILFGTVIAFFCYLESLKYLKATETSLLACAEPLSAAILAVIWLKVPFGLSEWFGAFCIIATIVILSRVKENEPVAYKRKERRKA